MDERAHRYAISDKFYKEGIRKYGFHGHSHKYVTEKVRKILGNRQGLKIVSAHLGNGSSVCASIDGKSMDTSMGLTPLEGLMMGQRSGDIDPSAIQILADNHQMSTKNVVDILNFESGFYGLTGLKDNRKIEDLALEESERLECRRARLSFDIFTYRLAKYIAAYIVPLEGLDILVFTGGIGEKSPYVRQRVIEQLKGLGFQLDIASNKLNQEGLLTTPDSERQAWMIKTNEELAIAQEVSDLMSSL